MRAPSAFVLLALLSPIASAGIPFEISMSDRAGDTVDENGRPRAAASADILGFTAVVENGTVIMRVQMAATPEPPADWILVRSWFANSTNGSYHALDIEVTPTPDVPDAWIVATLRDGDFFQPRDVPVTWRVEGSAWVFTFDASIVSNATCFDPGIFTHGAWADDALYPRERRCRQIAEPSRAADAQLRVADAGFVVGETNATTRRADVEATVVVANDGSADVEDLALQLKVRETRADFLAASPSVKIAAIPAGSTHAQVVNLSVPAGGEYEVEILVWRGSNMAARGSGSFAVSAPPEVNVRIVTDPVSPGSPAPTVEAPGTRTPTPAPGFALVAMVVAAIALAARRR